MIRLYRVYVYLRVDADRYALKGDQFDLSNAFPVAEKDAVTAIGTFLVCVFIGVEIGLLLGILVSLLFFIWPSARPTFQMVDYKVKRRERKIKVHASVRIQIRA
jgi:MFS superfamily sulfate permease-like transporter